MVQSCGRLLILCGDTYCQRLWCVWELYLVRHVRGRCRKTNDDRERQAPYARGRAPGASEAAAASEQGADIDYEAAREVVYKMPYSEWKEKHQLPATDEQLEKLAARQGK